MVECLTRDGEAAGSSLTRVTVLCPWARHINPSLVLVQPRKTRPYIFERLLMGPKESNQTNKQIYWKPLNWCFTSGEDPDEMPHNAAFHQGLHCL